MSLISEHVSALVVRIDALRRYVLAQLVPISIKVANVDGTPVAHALPIVAGITYIWPFWIRQAHAVSI